MTPNMNPRGLLRERAFSTRRLRTYRLARRTPNRTARRYRPGDCAQAPSNLPHFEHRYSKEVHTFTLFQADHCIGSLFIVGTFVEAVALRAVESDDAEASRKDLTLLCVRQHGQERRELVCCVDV